MKTGETKSPFEKFFNRPQDKTLTCIPTIACPKRKAKKFSPRGIKMLFIGYDEESTNFRLWKKVTRQVFISNDVKFCENLGEIYENIVENETTVLKLDFGMNEISNKTKSEIASENEAPIDSLNDTEIANNEMEPFSMQNASDINDTLQRRILRNRSSIQEPDRYGILVAYFTDAGPETYNEALLSSEAKK